MTSAYSREGLERHSPPPYLVEYTDEFWAWFAAQPHDLQDAIRTGVELLAEQGPTLGRPHAGTISHTSGYRTRHANLKELRVTHRGDAYRISLPLTRARSASC